MASFLARYAEKHPQLVSKFSGFKLPQWGRGGGGGGGGSGGGYNNIGGMNNSGGGGGGIPGPTFTNRVKAYKPTNTHIGISVAVAVIIIVLVIVLSVVLTRKKKTDTPMPTMPTMTMASIPTSPALTLPSATLPASTVLPSISPTTLAPTPGAAMAPQTVVVQTQTVNIPTQFPTSIFQVTSGRSAAWQGPSIPVAAGQPYDIQTSVLLWNNATSAIDTTTPFVVTLASTPPGKSVQYTWLMSNQKSGLLHIVGTCPASSSQPIIYIDTVPIGTDIIVSQYNNNSQPSPSAWVSSGCKIGPISSVMATALQTWASQNNIH